MRNARAFETRLEQCRQASAIHGGVLNACVAALAVRLSRVRIPSKRLRVRLYRTIYGRKYAALDESELEQPLWAYPSFNALFTRGVRRELRPISPLTNQFLCPCDGTVQEMGEIKEEKILTVKGVEYSVGSLLAGIDTHPIHNGHYAIIFLSPSDCHRIFSPQDGVIETIVHVPGYRLLVHPTYHTPKYPVFSLNERVILSLSSRLGRCFLILVAGWGVGNITFPRGRHFRPRLQRMTSFKHDPGLQVQKGDWIATFELGSTAILIVQSADRLITHLGTNEKVHYGQPVFSVPG
ncbi:MAG TPA: archaetidylserine decarboxylase [Gemmataceae bacterium]|jgi:phosphatidylserine decarboxylase